MGFKKNDQSIGFAELALSSSMKHNKTLKTLELLNETVNWDAVEKLLIKHYTVGFRSEGADCISSSATIQIPVAAKMVPNPLRSRA